MGRGFTGRHMTATMVGFFGVVIAVNLVMATAATRTFGGTVVDNSYVASQHFNRWLDQARSETRLGWSVAVEREGDRALLSLRNPAGSLPGARIDAIAEHPLGRLPDLALRFEAIGAGRYRSVEALPAGRWRIRLDIRQNGNRARFVDEVPA